MKFKNDKIREKSIERLINIGKELWADAYNEKKTVKGIFNTLKDDNVLVEHSNQNIAILCAMEGGTKAKRGIYIESMIYFICKELSNVSFLEGCTASGLQAKRSNTIRIPYLLANKIDLIRIDLMEKNRSLLNKEDIEGIFREIYDFAMSVEAQKDEDMVEWTQDLDIGVMDNLGDVYLYEVKKKGNFGADVAMNHFMHYFYTYADYVYNKRPAFERVHTNFILVEHGEDEFYKHLIHGDYGYITFKEFCARHNIVLSEEETRNIFHMITQVNDDEFFATEDRVRAVLKAMPQLKSGTAGAFLKEYRKFYPTRNV